MKKLKALCRVQQYLFSVIMGIALICASMASATDRLVVSRFGDKDMSGWEEKSFAGKSDYRFVEDAEVGWVLKGESQVSASGLFREMRVDLNKTPYLNWSWKAEKLPKVSDERRKEGDDYAARVYVIFKTGSWFWQTRALNYVWNSTYPVGTGWPNAFTENAYILALREKSAGQWFSEKRNVKADIEKYFGLKIETIEAVALMTDSDNSGDSASAFYGEIYFSSR